MDATASIGCHVAAVDPAPLRPPSCPRGGLALVGGRVVDPERDRSRPATVLIDGGTITGVTRPSEPVAPRRRIVDVTGRFVLPGLWDMHSHFLSPHDGALSLPLTLAHGVTGVRDMCSDTYPGERTQRPALDRFLLWRDEVRRGITAGPRLLALSSFYLDGPEHVPAGTPEFARAGTPGEARTAARYLLGRGVDFAKVYDRIPRDAYFALAEACRGAGLPFAGHKPWAVTTAEAAAAGQASVEHAQGVLWDCVRPGSRLGAQRATTRERRRMAIADHDGEAAARVCDALARHGTWFVPTHGTRWFDVRAVRDDLAADARLRYVPRPLRGEWDEDAASIRAANPERDDAASLERWYELGLAFTACAHAAGVTVLAGSDANDSYVFPGASLHDELAHLVRAGLTPAAALRAATSAAADALGMGDRHGRVAAGFAADLLVLHGDPLARVERTRDIAAVVHDGRVYDRRRIEGMLECVAATVART